MNSLRQKFLSKISSVYKNINPSTLNGAIDVIVVQQEDGTLRCTPFHVRFGKLGVIRSLHTKVYITINDVPVDDIYMQLGEAGEAFFIKEEIVPTTNQQNHHLDSSDSQTCLDSDNNAYSSETNPPSHLSNIDCSPETITEKLDEIDSNEPKGNYSYEKETQPLIKIDVIHSNTILSTRRRPRRRLFNRADQLDKQASEDEDQDMFNQYASLKRRPRARKRESIPTENVTDTDSIIPSNKNDKFRRSVKLLRKRSASENDLPLFQFDTDLSPLSNETSRFKSIDSRPKTLNLNEKNINKEDNFSIINENTNDKTTRTQSNPITIEQVLESTKSTSESEPLNSSILSQSAPFNTIDTNNLHISQSTDPVDDYYSHESTLSARPTSPKSDTEYELEKSSQASSDVGWKWKWGELPEQQKQSVFSYLWPSAKKTRPKEGMYLDDITNNQEIDRSLYLPPLDYQQQQQQQQRTTKDDDQESGTGNSIPQSPFREHETSCLLGDAQLSLCGNINKQYLITDELFNANLISFETFLSNPSVVNDPNLVVRIHGKYYNWSVASTIIVATSIYHKPLPNEVIEQLQEKNLAQTKARATGGSWWLPFYSKKSDMKTETSKITPTDVIAEAAKSEIVPTTMNRQNSTDNNKTLKTSKSDNDSEQEDSEVRKLTAKLEQEQLQKQQEQKQQQEQQRPPSTHQTTLKKTMILSSDELKQLNLKLGQNKVEFSVTTALQGTTTVESNIFLFDHMTKFVISDIDGTITKSDVLGHIIPLVGGDWSHDGIAEFYNAIQENGYQFIYLSARAIGQSQITRTFLKNVKQSNQELPIGPILVSPDTLMAALYREVIAKKPEDFKIECLKNIASLFPNDNPFYAGFGNRINDQWAYTAVGIPVTRIYTINPQGEVVREKLSQALLSSYRNLHEIVDLLFPPMDSFSASETYSSYTYWHSEPVVDAFEDEMRKEIDAIAQRQKSVKSNSKNKGLIPTTPTTIVKSSSDKLLAIAQATDNTVKRA